MAALSVVSVALVPPPHLPDLFPVLVSTTSFLHFLGTFFYFHVVQFSEPPRRKSQKKTKWMVPSVRDIHNKRFVAIFALGKRLLHCWECLLFMCVEAFTGVTMSHSANSTTVDRQRLSHWKRMNREPFWKSIKGLSVKDLVASSSLVAYCNTLHLTLPYSYFYVHECLC